MGLDARLAMGQENFNNLRNQVQISHFVVVALVFCCCHCYRGGAAVFYLFRLGFWDATAVSPGRG